MLFWYIDDLELRALAKQQMQGEAFSEFPHYLPKGRSSGRNSTVINSLLQDFIKRGRWTFTQKRLEETPHPDRLCHKRSHQPSIFLRAHSSFLKPLDFFQQAYLPPSFPLGMVCKLSNLIAFLSNYFSFL